MVSRLNVKFVQAAKTKGRFGDGGGLYLQVTPPNGKSWVLRTKIHGKTKYVGMGSAYLVSLAEARIEAARLRKIARSGGDPLAERKVEVITFEQAARRVHTSMLPSWKSDKAAANWLASLENHVFPVIGDRPIQTLTSQDLLTVLAPIWHQIPETARRIKQRMEVVFDWAKASGLYKNENPVTSVTSASLGAQTDRVKPMAAMPWSDVPGFMINLAQLEAVTARALAFSTLCGSRAGEVRGARWSEIDLETQIWTIPPHRMKGVSGKEHEHRVPLSSQAMEVLESVRELGGELVFPAAKGGELSDAAIRALLKRMGHSNITQHGFRTSFRTWIQDNTATPHEIAERCLAHKFGNKVSRAYARSDMLEERRPVMQSWANFALGVTGGKIINLSNARASSQ